MQAYRVKNLITGDMALLNGEAVEKIIGVEFGYVEWCINTDGLFENGRWRVWKLKTNRQQLNACA